MTEDITQKDPSLARMWGKDRESAIPRIQQLLNRGYSKKDVAILLGVTYSAFRQAWGRLKKKGAIPSAVDCEVCTQSLPPGDGGTICNDCRFVLTSAGSHLQPNQIHPAYMRASLRLLSEIQKDLAFMSGRN